MLCKKARKHYCKAKLLFLTQLNLFCRKNFFRLRVISIFRFSIIFSANTKMSTEKRFLHAMERGDVDAVDQMLKSKEVDVNKKLGNRFDMYPVLICGIRCGNPDIVACILENGADIGNGTTDVWNRSSLHYVIMNIKERRKTWNREAKQRAFKVFHLILEAYKKLGSQKLMEAAFIQRGCGGDTAFLVAIRFEVSDVVPTLLDLINEETVQFLNAGHFQSAHRTNPFHFVHQLNDEAMDALFDRLPFKEQMINQENVHGYTPLHFVLLGATMTGKSLDIHRQHRATVMLLNNGANPNLPDALGHTPLHWAIERGFTSISELLLRAGCRTDIFDNRGYSALKSAILSDRHGFRPDMETTIKHIKLLLLYGVDLDKELYLYADDELPVDYRLPAYENQINSALLQVGLLEKLRELRRLGALKSLRRRCRVAVLRNLKIHDEMETVEQQNANDSAIDSLPLPENLKSYLRGDGDNVFAMLDS